MNPNDINEPSAPPPSELPRPRVTMNDIHPAAQTPRQAPAHHEQYLLAQPHQIDRITAVGTPDKVIPRSATDIPWALPEIPQGISLDTASLPRKQPRSKRKLLLIVIGVLLALLVTAAVAAYSWYQLQLQPVDAGSKQHVRVVIEAGSTPSQIGTELEDKGVIRSQRAFLIFTQLGGTQNNLKAGTYNLLPSESMEKIVNHLVSGKQDEFTITFLPGDTLANHKKMLVAVGYSEAEIDAALSKAYDRPLFAGKPAGTDLEGYIFGETYSVFSSASVEDILNRTFDEYEAFIAKNNLVAQYKQQGLSLYEGITLASVIQKEVSGAEDSQKVAQVFYKRIKEGISLGADSTFVYAAKKAGVAPTVDFDSLYNTRTHLGLPPGPISSPGVNALMAAAKPASTDYTYFVSGDDGKNYFSKTLEEHNALTRQHCQKNCALF